MEKPIDQESLSHLALLLVKSSKDVNKSERHRKTHEHFEKFFDNYAKAAGYPKLTAKEVLRADRAFNFLESN